MFNIRTFSLNLNYQTFKIYVKKYFGNKFFHMFRNMEEASFYSHHLFIFCYYEKISYVLEVG